MKTFDVYGVRAASLQAARALVEDRLRVCFALHDSMYLGGDYYRAKTDDGGSLQLVGNYNQYEGEYRQPGHKDILYLLYVNALKEPDRGRGELVDESAMIILLQRREV